MTKVSIPTGYEPQLEAAARKRKLAETLMAQGLAPQQGMTNWAQVFGQLMQAWAGKRLDSKADKMQSAATTGMQQDHQVARQALMDDVNAGADVKDLWQKHGANPFLQEDIKPFAEAFGHRLSADQDMIQNGSQFMRKGDALAGGVVQGKPTDSVVALPDGTWRVNPVHVTAAQASQGMDISQYPQQMQNPYAGLAQTMGQAAQPAPKAGPIPQVPTGANIPMGSPLTGAPNGRIVIDPDTGQPKQVWEIGGRIFDNPEGQ